MFDIKELLGGIHDCECGREHVCPIEAVEIGENALLKLKDLCESYKKILLVSDENTYRVCGEKIASMLGEKIESSLVFECKTHVLVPNEEALKRTEDMIKSDTDLIIGAGSGVINDICKYTSFKNDLPYFIAATAPSMDGFASVGAALILEGMKITLNARPPRAIIADTSILADAPKDMIRAGYGDIIGKFSCLNDWKLSKYINGEYFCEKIYSLTMQTAEFIRDSVEKIEKCDKEAVGELTKALVAIGILMSFVGSSRPGSGSEHHLSHFFEITGLLRDEPYLPHGTDVIFSAIETAKLRRLIINGTPHAYTFDREKRDSDIRRIYGSSAEGIIALQDKVGEYEREDRTEGKWEMIREILKEVPSPEEFTSMARAAGLCPEDFKSLYGDEKINESLLYAKDLKDRYTVLWLYYKYFA